MRKHSANMGIFIPFYNHVPLCVVYDIKSLNNALRFLVVTICEKPPVILEMLQGNICADVYNSVTVNSEYLIKAGNTTLQKITQLFILSFVRFAKDRLNCRKLFHASTWKHLKYTTVNSQSFYSSYVYSEQTAEIKRMCSCPIFISW